MSTPAHELTVVPIGFVRSPFVERHSAPRQPSLAADVEGRIELLARPELEHGLSDLESWSHVWVLYWLHLSSGFRPMVEAPRSTRKRGVLATRSPYRPNPIGLSPVRLLRVEGRVLHVRGLDMLDGTPVLDIKPYVPYSDIVPEANSGWLEHERRELVAPEDPGPRFEVTLAPAAATQLQWLRARGVEIESQLRRVLCAGPAPHPYRRIRREGKGLVLAVKDWRVRFEVEGNVVQVTSIASGYKPRALHDPKTQTRGETSLDVHRAFVTQVFDQVTSDS